MTDDQFDEPEEGYQSLSTAAVAAVVLGVLSPLVIFGPLLIVLPCLAIVLAGAALRSIARSDGALTGRRMALAGLALGVASLSGWLAYGRTNYSLLHAQAAPVARAMLDSLQQHDAQQSYLLTLLPEERAATRAYFNSPEFKDPTDTALQDSDSPEARLDRFRQQAAVAALLSGGDITGYRRLSRGAAQSTSAGRSFVVQTYRVERPDAADVDLRLTIELRPGDGEPIWRVTDVSAPAPGG